MKKTISLMLAFGMLFTICCKPAKKTTTVQPVNTDNTANMQKEADLKLQVAQARWPGTVVDELNEGQTIYTTKCVRCHKNFAVEKFEEKKWLHEIDDMSPKAKLTAEEKQKLTKFILSSREAKEKMKGN